MTPTVAYPIHSIMETQTEKLLAENAEPVPLLQENVSCHTEKSKLLGKRLLFSSHAV